MTETIHTYTNEIEVDFDHPAVANDFDIYMIDIPFCHRGESSKKEFPKTFFSEVRQKLKPLGRFVYTQHGKKKYVVLTPKGTPADIQSFSMRKLGLSEFRSLPDYGKLRLLFSLMTGEEITDKSILFETEGNPYSLYYIHPQRNDPNTIITLSPEVTGYSQGNKLLLSMNVVTFRRISKPGKYPVFVSDGGILRLYDPLKDKDKPLFQKGNYPGTKKRSSVSFFTLETEHFHHSKSSQYAFFLKKAKLYLQRYANIQNKLYTLELYSGLHNKPLQKIRTEEMIKQYINEVQSIHIAVLDETCRLSASVLPRLFESVFSHAGNLFDRKISFTFSENISLKKPTISVTREKEFYEENNLEDPYLAMDRITPVQNITLTPVSSSIENCTLKEIMKHLGIGKEKIEVTFKELAIKCELYGREAFTSHDKSLTGIRYFSVESFSAKKDAEDPVFHKAELHEDGKIQTSSPTEEELSRLKDAVIMHTGYREYPEFAIIDENNHLFLGIRTPLLAIPDIETLSASREKMMKPYYFQKEEVIAAAKETGTYLSGISDSVEIHEGKGCSEEAFLAMLESIQTYKGISSIKLLKQNKSLVPQKLKNRLSLISKTPMAKTLTRSKEGKKLFAGLLGIAYQYEGNTLYYHAHTEGYNSTKSKIEKASPFRKVVSEYDTERIRTALVLPLLEHYFVRHKEITVLPYPVKYAREGYKILF